MSPSNNTTPQSSIYVMSAKIRLDITPYPDFDDTCSRASIHKWGTWCPIFRQCGMPWNTELPFPGSDEDDYDDPECIQDIPVGPPGSVLEGVDLHKTIQIETIALILSTKVNGKFQCAQLDLASRQENFEILEAAARRVLQMKSVLLQSQSSSYHSPSCFLILERVLRWPEMSSDDLLDTFFSTKPNFPPFQPAAFSGASVDKNPNVDDVDTTDPGAEGSNEDSKDKTAWQLFPDQDMTPARLSVREPHKFLIQCIEFGTAKEKIFRFRGWRDFDWNDKETVHKLNKFRRQINSRCGGAKEEKGKPWTEIERDTFKQLIEKELGEGKVKTKTQLYEIFGPKMIEFFKDLIQVAGAPLALKDVANSSQDVKDGDEESSGDETDTSKTGSKAKAPEVLKENRLGLSRCTKTMKNKVPHFHDIRDLVDRYFDEEKSSRIKSLESKKGKGKEKGKGMEKETKAAKAAKSKKTVKRKIDEVAGGEKEMEANPKAVYSAALAQATNDSTSTSEPAGYVSIYAKTSASAIDASRVPVNHNAAPNQHEEFDLEDFEGFSPRFKRQRM